MSLKGKTGKRQANRSDEGPVPTKRRKGRPKATPAADDEDEGWTPRNVGDMKANAIYNQRAPEAPAELFRKDLISAMKLPDSEPLNPDEYWVITDQWKQDWERGVQVPVNPDSLPQPSVTVTQHSHPRTQEFRLPKTKYIRITKDSKFRPDEVHFSSVAARAEASCHYDLDDVDVAWLTAMNGERALMGLPPITEEQLERVLEELERRCWDKIQGLVKAEEGLGIEYDENVICDVCRSPDSEEGNEMVFCDVCNICVHQACYGITSIPPGSWLCRTCALSKRPECVLCPNKEGAMKCTKSGHEWAHVSCALWIPEVSIGCVERMEPITKISNIPPSRWALICVLCRERVGACIQCSVKTCKTAYHVTCAFKHGLEMKAIIEDENADDGVKLRSYCQKHSVKKENRTTGSDDEESRRKKRKDMTSEEKNQARAAKRHEIEAEFYKHVSVADVSGSAALLEVDSAAIESVYNYWKLKRRTGDNKPLLPPRSDEGDLLSKRQEQQDLDKMRMFVQLRQDLERVRNLCYMVSRREKLSRTFFRTREQTFHKQVALLVNGNLNQTEVAAVIEANHGPSIYDRLCSHPLAQDNTENFNNIVARIEGVTSPELKNRQDLNGLIKSNDTTNPYKRMYFNGAARRRSLFGSTSESETDIGKQKFSALDRLGLHSADSSTEDEKKQDVRIRSKKNLDRRRKTQDPKLLDSSSSDERWKSPRGRSLRQMERDMRDKSLSEDSDDLLPLPKSDNSSRVIAIYSDSDSDTSLKDDRSSSSHNILKTKGELKAFTGVPKINKENKGRDKSEKSPRAERSRNSPDGKYLKKSRRDLSNDDEENRDDKENIKSSKKGFDPSDLIVPQRQAAKKASENMKCFQGKRDENVVLTDDLNKIDKKDNDRYDKLRNRMKSKSRSIREERSKSSDIFDFDHSDKEECSDVLAYVPQRQAAKKAAETIKCGMKPSEETKFLEKKKEDPKKVSDKFRKTPISGKSPKASKFSSSSTSSSSSSSSSTSSSSSSESEEEPRKSIFDPEPKKKTDDSPFLDKGCQSKTDDGKKFKKAPDKKLKTSDGRPEIEFQPPAFEGEESRKRCMGDRIGSSSTRPGNFVSNSIGSSSADSDRRKRKSFTELEECNETRSKSSSFTPKKSSKEVDLEMGVRHERSTPKKPTKLDKLLNSMEDKKEDESLRKEEQCLRRGPGRPRKEALKKPEEEKTISYGGVFRPLHELKNDRIKDNRDKFIPVGGDEKTDDKLKVKPMPKSVKKALGLLDESSSPDEDRKESEALRKVEQKAIEKSEFLSGCDVSNKNYDKDKFRRSSSISISGRTDLDNEAKLGINLKNNNHNDSNIINDIASSDVNVDGKSELSLPNLSVEEKDEKHSPTLDDSARSNFTLDLGFSDAAEPKKISSRTSSLGVSIYQQRSIFSPQTSNRDQLSDIFDFENDMLAVDETVQQDSRPLPLFNFNNEFLFKEDSKEDSKRETYNLVEKLRMDYAKKTTNHQDASSPITVPDEIPQTEIKQENLPELSSIKAQESVQSIASDIFAENNRVQIPTIKNTLDSFNRSPGYGKGPPPTPGYHLEPQNIMPQINTTDIGKFTPSSQDNLPPLSIVKSVDSPVYQKVTPNSGELPHQRYQEGHNVVQNVGESPARYPPPRQGFESMDPYDTFYSSCTAMPHDPNSIAQVREKVELPGTVEDRWIPPNSNASSVYQSPSETPYHSSISPYRGNRRHWPESEVISRRSTSTSSTESSKDDNEVNKRPETQPIQHIKPCTDLNETDIKPPENISYHQGMDDQGKVNASVIPQELQNDFVDTIKPDIPNKHGDLIPFQQMIPKSDETIPFQHSEIYHGGMPPFLPDNAPYNPYSEATPFVASVAVFPPSACSTMPFPSPGPAMFPPSFPTPFPTPHSMIHAIPPKPEEAITIPSPCSASFTSSQHNMALTAAIVSPSPVTPNTMDQPLTPAQFSNALTPSHQMESPQRPLANSSSTTPNKKLPVKATRVSARVISQGKSPGKSPAKSPGKSPRQMQQDKVQINKVKDSAPKRARAPAAGSRARGRGRGRGKGAPLYDDLTIRTKLEGTVYDMDFDEEGTCDGMENLKAMRERRRSTDIHDRKSDAFLTRDQNSPIGKFTCSLTKQGKTPVSPVAPTPVAPPSPVQTFPDVAPPLPGPVDMRTYSTFETPSTSAEYLLNAFANPAETAHVNEFDEEMEKEFHSALKASRPASPPKEKTPPAQPPMKSPLVTNVEPAEMPEPSNKVSLNDSRNQLKVKIKGPFLDANYATSNTPLPAPPPAQATPPAATINAAVTGTSSLRRMRKKELLRQYWNQDMNTDDPAAPITPAAPPPSRSCITIPKAVASMTSIPTREDYKALIDANMDKKRKKEKPARDFRTFDLTFPPPDDEISIPERRASTGSNPSLVFDGATPKRRARANKPNTAVPNAAAPKLKIKIGGTAAVAMPAVVEEKKNLRVRPPKKRHCNMVMPSVEELKRESMKYRRMIMADFEEDKKSSKTKSKKKKKKSKDVQVIGQSFGPPKIIIKFGKPGEVSERLTVDPTPRTQHDSDGRTEAPPPFPPIDEVDPLAIDPLELPSEPQPDPLPSEEPSVVTVENQSDSTTLKKVRTSKTTPIRLKISRCEEGYVMAGGKESPPSEVPLPPPPPPPTQPQPTATPTTPPPAPAPSSSSESPMPVR